ncbi:metallophosphoesterase [Lysobacter yangpyeongensis]|uniref:Metallophosphoesterase n=1 Tax=Lysobacter yangpyeongensis TaxID=346182 RepID=A0ABW0SJC7_9GAMM
MLLIAHITDIHILNDLDPALARPEKIGAAIASHVGIDDQLVILVTGDVAQSGRADEYQLALTFFRRIQQYVKTESGVESRFIVCPGNHDCDLSGPQDLRKLVLKQLSEKPADELSPQFLDTCVRVQDEFFRFRSDLTGQAYLDGADRLRYHEVLDIRGVRVAFDCLNLAWVSQLKEDKVTFPASILPGWRADDGCVITAMHHPFNWLHPSSYRDFRRRVRANADFVFTGHEHEWNVVETEEREAGRCVQFEGSVLQERRSEVSGFAIVELDLAGQQYRVFKYAWGSTHYERQDSGAWARFRRFELTAPADSWVPTKAIERELSDLGATLRVGGKADVCLEDVFIFPDLEAASDDGDDASTSVHGETLVQNPANANGFVLEGDDRSGRTTLLKHFFRKYYDAGCVPILINGTVMSRATEDAVDAILESHIRAQYDRLLPDYLQLPRAKRVLLIDDFDEVPIKSERARAQLLSRLRARCGATVLSVSDVFEAAQFADMEDGSADDALPKYRILPFGRLSRTKLIGKWVTIDSEEFLSEDERIARIDEATKYMETVVRWNVVPRYPIYLLTLLQAQKAGSPENFKDSGLGYYYQYLISDSMLAVGLAKDELTEVEQYCSQLAWWIKGLGRTYVSFDELGDFNRVFAEKWVGLDFALLRDQLLRCRILSATGEIVEFRYSYIYYFFVAKYLAENFDEPEAQEFVASAASQLYVRSNANILVFLTHFANKSTVIDAIVATLKEQFGGLPIAQFADRNESVEKMLRQLPGIVYEGGKPEENREAEARRQDALRREPHDGLRDAAEEAEELSFSARLTVVFKTVEILGQILKTQYSRIPRVKREAIIEEMLNGPLRALEVFYASLRESPESLVADFEARLAEEGGDGDADSRRTIAEKVVGSIVLSITFGFIRKVAEAVGSNAIADDLRAVVQRRADLGHMLIRLATLLDGQRGLPRVDIEAVRRGGAGSLIVDRVVQVLVVYHMYMFRTSFPDIEWAHNVLGIPNRVKLRTMITGSSLMRQSGPPNNR